MIDVQIFGLIVSLVAIVCGTILIWKWINSKREVEREKNAANRASHDKVFHDNTWAMYESEHGARIQAEKREQSALEQLRKERNKVARLEQIMSNVKLSDVEGVRVTW